MKIDSRGGWREGAIDDGTVEQKYTSNCTANSSIFKGEHSTCSSPLILTLLRYSFPENYEKEEARIR